MGKICQACGRQARYRRGKLRRCRCGARRDCQREGLYGLYCAIQPLLLADARGDLWEVAREKLVHTLAQDLTRQSMVKAGPATLIRTYGSATSANPLCAFDTLGLQVRARWARANQASGLRRAEWLRQLLLDAALL